MKKWWWLLPLIVVLVAAGWGAKTYFTRMMPVAYPTPTPFLTNWTDFEYKSWFKIKAPPTWKKTDFPQNTDFDARMQWEPQSEAQRLGNVGQLAVTVVSQPKKGQPLSTQAEFDNLYQTEFTATSSGTVQKLDNTTLDGQNAVMLVDVGASANQDFWTIVIWARKQGINYYVQGMGNDRFNVTDAATLRSFAEGFKFWPGK